MTEQKEIQLRQLLSGIIQDVTRRAIDGPEIVFKPNGVSKLIDGLILLYDRLETRKNGTNND